MLCNCKSLASLPDISKCHTNSVKDATDILKGCSKLTNITELNIGQYLIY